MAELDSIHARDILAQNFLFAGVEDKIIAEIAALARQRHYDRGEMIFLRGDEGNSLFILLSGMVRISTSSAEGREITLNMLESGDVFGEIAFLDGLPRTADATAMQPCATLVIPRSEFAPILAREAALAIHMIEFLCERIRWTSEAVQDSALLALHARLAKRLLYLATVYGAADSDGGMRIGLRLSQADLGQMLGTTRESINKQLQSWRKEGLIDLVSGHIILRDQAALQKIVAEGET